ncbi:MAG: hypothetical protein IH977_13865 [Nitrospinae bacterium]|nr:hypothetical protein [Nitrospinota bacterium]
MKQRSFHLGLLFLAVWVWSGCDSGQYGESLPPRTNIDLLLDEMEFGTIVFNVPTTINISDSPQIQLILSLSEAMDELKQSITEEGERIGATIRISNRMEARLSGYMFQITAITPETQAVSKIRLTEWKWEIHPKEEGQHKLHLTLTALLEIDGHSTPRAIRTFSKNIEVNVTATQKIEFFFQSKWQWLWAAILVPVAGWLWKRRKKQLTNTSS